MFSITRWISGFLHCWKRAKLEDHERHIYPIAA
jgi:hypothetical protein